MYKVKYIKVTSILATIIASLSLTVIFGLKIYSAAFEEQADTLKPYIFLAWWGVVVAGFLYTTILVLGVVTFGVWVGSHFSGEDDEEYDEWEYEEYDEDAGYDEDTEQEETTEDEYEGAECQ